MNAQRAHLNLPLSRMETLWLALYLPQLSLDIHPALAPGKAVVEQNRIVACDAAALQAGVHPWMKPALARSLLPNIAILPRDADAEQSLLNTLACWAGTWTPRICVVPQTGLLLEIGSCLRLFGGFERLHGAIIAGLNAQGYVVCSAAAPVAQGALWLALAGKNGVRVDRDAMSAALDALPLSAVANELPADCITRLNSFGLSTLGELRRLPQSALTRRIGTGVMLTLACTYGEVPDMREAFVFPSRFDLRLELPVPVDNAEALLFASRRLVQALSGWLTTRQGGVRECMLLLEHRQCAATPVALRFAETLRDGVRIEAILRERLPRIILKTQVEALHLVADSVLDLPGQSQPLFRKDGAQAAAMPALMERLRARLGEAAVHGYTSIAEHRPECVSARRPTGRSHDAVSPPRPLYLLQTPQSLSEQQGRPHHRNEPLVLLAGPERIESGWWDEGERNADDRPTGDIRRDYFVALAPDQRWLWIYRECRADFDKGGGWFLHGYFS